MLVSFWLGAKGLDADPIWNDEWYMIRDSRVSDSPLVVYNHVGAQNPWHAPGYFLLLNLWGWHFTWTPAAMRAVALLMGMLGIAWTYRLGRDHLSPRVGLFAALILASSAFYIHYFHETRMYTTTVMLTAFTVWVYFNHVHRQREPGWLMYLALLAAVVAMLHTHYFLSLILGGICLYHLLFVHKNWRWLRVTAVIALGGATFVPWVANLLRVLRTASARELEAKLAPDEAVIRLASLFSHDWIPLLLALLALSLAAVFFWRGRAGRSLRAVWFIVVMALTGVLVTNTVVNIMTEGRSRYMIFTFALLATIAAAGMVQLGSFAARHRVLRTGLPVALLSLWLVIAFYSSIDPRFTAELPGSQMTYPLHHVMRSLRDIHRPGDYIVNVLPDSIEWRRYSHNVPFYVWAEELAADSSSVGGVMPAGRDHREGYDLALNAIGSGRDYVWVAYQLAPNPPLTLPIFEDLLTEQTIYQSCGQAVAVDDIRVNEYARSPVCCTPETAPQRDNEIIFDNGLVLVGIDPLEDRPADKLVLFVAWEGGDRLPPNTYSVGLHILDADENLVAQTDYGLPADDFLCQPQEIDISGLPPGQYRLMVVVYDWRSGERLPGTLVSTGMHGDLIALRSLTISQAGVALSQ
jgi:hypothetical protein